MNVNDLFTHKKFIPLKRTREHYQRDPKFRKIIESDPKLKDLLDRPDELRELHDKMREKAKDGKLDRYDMQKIVYDLAHGGGEDISSLEGRKIAREFFPDSTRRYRHDDPEPEKKPTDIPKSQNAKSNSRDFSAGKANKVPPTSFTYRSKFIRASSEPIDKTGSKKTGYFNALRSVERNK